VYFLLFEPVTKYTANVLPLCQVADFEALTFNLALNQPFCQTAVGGSYFLFILIFLFLWYSFVHLSE
jgi:hypothetical protein